MLQAELVLQLNTQFQTAYNTGGNLGLKLGPTGDQSKFTLNINPLLNLTPYDVEKPAQPAPAAGGTGPVSWTLEADGTDISALDSHLRNATPKDGSTYYPHLNLRRSGTSF